jgi:alcohol dehydrogenase (cytochrome c)
MIVVGGTLYATTKREVVAIDAGTCALKWRVREEEPPAGGRGGTGTNRGLAYLDGRLFRGMPEGDVIAYDAGSGKKVWSSRIADRTPGESVPAAPIAWNGLVFVGNAGGDAYGVKGRIYALNAATGAVIWTTYTVPTEDPQPGNEKMQAQALCRRHDQSRDANDPRECEDRRVRPVARRLCDGSGTVSRCE